MRHHVFTTQDDEELCGFLDRLQEDGIVVSVHCIPDVPSRSWAVIWKHHSPRAKSAIGFGVGEAERRTEPEVIRAELQAPEHTGDSETCPHAIGKPRWCSCEEKRAWP